MTRHLFFVLLLMTVVALAQDRSGAQQAAGAAQAQAKPQAAQGRSENAQAQMEKAPKPAAEAPGKKEPAQAQAEDAQKPTEEGQAKTEEDGKLVSVPGGKALGMSILGNQEAPKSLVIVPWKASELGRSPSISPMLDDSRQPVDKEVFLRALRYYEIMSEKKP